MWCLSFVPPTEASARSLAQATWSARRRAVTTNIARSKESRDQVDYAGLVTSRDFTEFSGESSVERSIMVVRLLTKVTRSTGFRPVSVSTGIAGTLCGEEGKGHVGHRSDDDTPPVARHAVPELRARHPHLPGVRGQLQLQACPDAGNRRLTRGTRNQGWSSTLTERRSSIARYPSATSDRGSVESNTSPGLIRPSSTSFISSGR